MLRVYADFSDRDRDGACWLLNYQSVDLADQVAALEIKRGDKVTLYQDEDDFEVVATLDFRYVDVLARETWVAVPDWSTLVRKK